MIQCSLLLRKFKKYFDMKIVLRWKAFFYLQFSSSNNHTRSDFEMKLFYWGKQSKIPNIQQFSWFFNMKMEISVSEQTTRLVTLSGSKQDLCLLGGRSDYKNSHFTVDYWRKLLNIEYFWRFSPIKKFHFKIRSCMVVTTSKLKVKGSFSP